MLLTAAICLAQAPRQAIAFQSDRDGNDEIYLMGPGGERPVNLTRTSGAQDRGPVWSPDGTRLAFSSDRMGKWDLYLLDLASRRWSQLVGLDVFNVPYSWSPDGRWISFHTTSGRSSDPGSNYLVSDDGTQVRPLDRGHPLDSPPIWSPDGRWVAFVSGRDGNTEIYVSRPDGSAVRNLSRSPMADEDPAWSPDGSRLAFVSGRDGNTEIYIAAIDGSDAYNLTRSPGSEASPTWSPDGRRIAFATRRDGNWEIYAVDPDGGRPVNLTRNRARDTGPAWRPRSTKGSAVRPWTWARVKGAPRRPRQPVRP